MTKDSLEKLKKKVDYLKTVKRKEIAERLRRAISFGDLSENAEYDEARQAQSFLEGQILELEQLIRNAKIREPLGLKGIAEIGSKVLLEAGGEKTELQLVSSVEADLLKGKISIESPLGRALLGKRKGDKIQVKTPQGRIEYKILKVAS